MWSDVIEDHIDEEIVGKLYENELQETKQSSEMKK